jgi:rfaE bifunctional protein kinase chain/domain
LRHSQGFKQAMTLSDLSSRYQGKRLVFVSGNFNIIHPGHLRLLSFAKSCGDALVVGLFVDGADGTMVRFEDRKASLLALEAVNEVIALEPSDLLGSIASLKPHTVVKGKEHEALSNSEQEVISAYGGHLLFSSGEQTFSSRDLIRQELANPSSFRGRIPTSFLGKHSLQKDQLLTRVKAFTNLKVLVVGDLIIDEYIYCDPLGMSQEDPTIVVTPVETQSFIGAAGIVAAHLAGLGATVDFVSIVGNDTKAQESAERLRAMRVKAQFVLDESRPTIVKQRFRAQGKTLLRVSHLRSHDAAREYHQEAFERIDSCLQATDLVVFSDFNYGCLPQPLVNLITSTCNKKGIPYVADSQASSQVGNVGRFVGADFLAATEREVRLATNDFKSGLQNVANVLISQASAKHLLVKLGAEGLIAIKAANPFLTDSLPALNANPVDVAGAGDAMLAAASLCRQAGGSIFEAAYLGSLAAAIQVSRTGNLPIQAHDLMAALIRD